MIHENDHEQVDWYSSKQGNRRHPLGYVGAARQEKKCFSPGAYGAAFIRLKLGFNET